MVGRQPKRSAPVGQCSNETVSKGRARARNSDNGVKLIFGGRSGKQPLDQFNRTFGLAVTPRVLHGGEMRDDAMTRTKVLEGVAGERRTTVNVAVDGNAKAMNPGSEEFEYVRPSLAGFTVRFNVLGVRINKDQAFLTPKGVKIHAHGVPRSGEEESAGGGCADSEKPGTDKQNRR